MLRGVRYVGWGLTAAAVVMFAVMVSVTLPHLSHMAGGMAMFDQRLLGYDYPVALDIVTRLGTDGVLYYADVQQRLDSLFAIMACLAAIFWIISAAQRWQGHGLPLMSPVLAAVLATAVIAAGADLGENAAVAAMLAVGPKGLTPPLVHTANSFSLAKTFFTGVALLSLLALALGPVIAGIVRRGKR